MGWFKKGGSSDLPFFMGQVLFQPTKKRKERTMKKPVLIIHGGIGRKSPSHLKTPQIHASLENIIDSVYAFLEKGGSAVEACVRAAKMLEDDPLFNAGRGSKIQADGKIRMSAGLMDGARLRFSGVVNVQGLRNPVELAQLLAREQDRVLSDDGARIYAKHLGLTFRSPFTTEAWESFEKGRRGKTGTIGVVALDKRGRLAASTSTGGKGMEIPGRVSDSPTVAGNYANAFCGVSATGTGEEIVEFALAAKIATRVEDGMKLQAAFNQSFREARRHGFHFGAIGIGRDGSYAASTTDGSMSWAARSGSKREIHPS